MNEMIEHFFQCPYCWEEVSILLDASVKNSVFIEDCEVCCNPIEVEVEIENTVVKYININTIEQ